MYLYTSYIVRYLLPGIYYPIFTIHHLLHGTYYLIHYVTNTDQLQGNDNHNNTTLYKLYHKNLTNDRLVQTIKQKSTAY